MKLALLALRLLVDRFPSTFNVVAFAVTIFVVVKLALLALIFVPCKVVVEIFDTENRAEFIFIVAIFAPIES